MIVILGDDMDGKIEAARAHCPHNGVECRRPRAALPPRNHGLVRREPFGQFTLR